MKFNARLLPTLPPTPQESSLEKKQRNLLNSWIAVRTKIKGAQ